MYQQGDLQIEPDNLVQIIGCLLQGGKLELMSASDIQSENHSLHKVLHDQVLCFLCPHLPLFSCSTLLWPHWPPCYSVIPPPPGTLATASTWSVLPQISLELPPLPLPSLSSEFFLWASHLTSLCKHNVPSPLDYFMPMLFFFSSFKILYLLFIYLFI